MDASPTHKAQITQVATFPKPEATPKPGGNMRNPVLWIALILAIPEFQIGCQRKDTNQTDSHQTANSDNAEDHSCSFDSTDTAARQSQTAALLVDQSGSMEASLEARCVAIGVQATKLLNSLKNKFDLELFVAATGKRAAPQIILDFTHISTRVDANIDDPLANVETIERKELALWNKHVAHVRGCVVSKCKMTTRSNSRILDLVDGTLQQVGVRCRRDPSLCNKVSVIVASDLADDDVFLGNAKSRVKQATLGIKQLEMTACGTHQVKAASLTQQKRYEAAWRILFGAALEIMPTCPGSQLPTTGRSS